MKTISLWLCLLTLTLFNPGFARAQDSETSVRLNKMEGYVQDLQAAQHDQKEQIQALEKEIADLRDKLNQPAANNYASAVNYSVYRWKMWKDIHISSYITWKLLNLEMLTRYLPLSREEGC